MKVTVGYQEKMYNSQVHKGLVYYKMNEQGKPVLLRYSISGVEDGDGYFSSNDKPKKPIDVTGNGDTNFGEYSHYIKVGCCGGTIWFKGWRE